VDTLLIGGELAFSTPPVNATKELLPHLPNGHQVVRPAFGHSGSFWADQPEAGRRLVNTFLDSGKVDHSDYRP
jgi:TAP-like protein